MIQRGQHLGLTLESGHAFRIVREHLGQNSNTPSTDGREDLEMPSLSPTLSDIRF
jgi:hypothetical protein